jgi:hypothetical protein
MKSAKIFLAILLVAIMAVSFALPALADSSVGTYVTVSSSNGTAPAVLALWAHDGGNAAGSSAYESADMVVPHGTLGIQIMPTQGYQVTHDITFVAIVTDANGASNLTHVYADVTNPDGSFKFEVELTRVATDDSAVVAFDAAAAANMVAINTAITDPGHNNDAVTKGEIDIALNQQTAYKYWGTYHFDNCQLAGTYGITINALNTQTLVGSYSVDTAGAAIQNWFQWMPLVAADFDFSYVNYGSVTMGLHKEKPGDNIWNGSANDGSPATMRNIGNTYIFMTVKEDDMGLGATQIDGVNTWNLNYDARLGDGDVTTSGLVTGYITYVPTTVKVGGTNAVLNAASGTPTYQILNLCSQVKVDFSIQVNKDLTPGTQKSGTMILGASNANLSFLSTDSRLIGDKIAP